MPTLDCGHPPTPTDGLGTGRAYLDGKTICYGCAADHDRETLAAGTPTLAYVKPWPGTAYDAQNRVKIITWAGVELGWGWVARGDRYATRYHVNATIGGRKYWGWTPANSGDYVTLRAYK